MNTCNIVLILVVFAAILVYFLNSSKEEYRDPIYLNRSKMVYDWYPKSNGSIYGMPHRYGGSWSIMSGYTWYPKAY